MIPSRVLTLLTFAAVAACGNGEPGGEPAAVPASGAIGPTGADTAAAAVDTVPAPPALPADFPSDFPLPPDHVVLESSTSRDVAGTFSRARLAVAAPDAETPYAWYRQALVDAGWQIAAEGRANGGRTLHATQGESYVDLSVALDAATTGQVVIEASIWKVEAL